MEENLLTKFLDKMKKWKKVYLTKFLDKMKKWKKIY